ncbi:MAG TPA: N-acetyltransferase family protein [Drouetiella sp.]
MALIRTARLSDAKAIQAIYAPFCLTNAYASFEYMPPDVDEMKLRMETVQISLPWLVYEESNRVIGYALASQYQVRAAYGWSVSVSIYLAAEARGRGVGKKLYTELFEILRRLGYFNAYAGITLPNPGSVALHKSMGFTQVGLTPKVGYKGGAWHDVLLLGLELQPHIPEPPAPKKFDGSFHAQV